MAAGIPFMEVTGRKAVQNGGRSNSKNDHGFWTLFVTFDRKNSLLLLLTLKLSFSHSFKLHNKIGLLVFRSPLKQSLSCLGTQKYFSLSLGSAKNERSQVTAGNASVWVRRLS